jgi:RimJ/RimL family protein N-acetyltransferase
MPGHDSGPPLADPVAPMPLPPIPPIRASRVTIREVAEPDLVDLLEVNGDDEVTRYLPYATWGRGYATEALQAVCRHLFEDAGIRRIEAEARPDNVASNELLQSLGFTHEGRLRQRWVAKDETYDTNIYGLLIDDWRQRHARGGK